jgi:tetratricopeptide (TPR) repeat protein
MRKKALAWLLASGALAACQLIPAPRQAETQAVLARTTVLPSTPIRYPTLPPEWTATWTPTPTRVVPTASATASATPTAPYSKRLAAAKADITRATNLTNSGQYAAALALWNKLIPKVPEYADAYYQRTRCLMHLAPAIRVKTDYIAGMQQALADMNQALSLDTRNGNYFHERQFIYYNLAQLELYRADQDYWEGLALADAQAAVRFGTTIAYADRDAAYRLIDVGHPQEAFDLFSTLPPVPGRKRETDADLQVGLAESQFAQGFVDEALQHLDLAIKANPADNNAEEKAIMLLSQSKPADALVQINKLSASGALCACGYYLRALIYYQLGKPDQAQADIATGTPQTWERGGLRSYVLALLALDQGDQKTGKPLLQEAQASLPRRYGPVLLKQIQAKLDQLGVARLDPTPYAKFTATPMPTPP